MDLHYRDSAPSEKTLDVFWKLTPTTILSKEEKVELPSKQTIQWPTKIELIPMK